MQVSDSHLSVAALTDENLSNMRSVESAPLLKAVVVGKGADFTNEEGDHDGDQFMPQVGFEPGTCAAWIVCAAAQGAEHCIGLGLTAPKIRLHERFKASSARQLVTIQA